MKRLTLVIPSLTSGGAERVMTTLANAWADRGHEVTLITFDDSSATPFYPLNPGVELQQLGIAGNSSTKVAAIRNTISRIWKLRQAIQKSNPDLVLAFLDTTNVTTILASRGLGTPVIVEEHTDPAQKNLGQRWVRLRDAMYPRADRIVVLSEQSRSYFNESIRRKTSIIPNPIVVEPATEPTRGWKQRRTLIALGRLGPEKGFDLLIDSFSRIESEFSTWDLVIWGDGALRNELTAQIESLGLKGRISLPGRTQQPHDELRHADIFVMSSRREGFPMALGEAMACGLPAISTDCPSGPRQIIRDGIDGVLVEPENPDALAAAMRSLMSDESLREAFAARAPEVLDRFGLERVLAIWDALFSEIEHARKPRESRQIRTFGSTQTGTANGTDG